MKANMVKTTIRTPFTFGLGISFTGWSPKAENLNGFRSVEVQWFALRTTWTWEK